MSKRSRADLKATMARVHTSAVDQIPMLVETSPMPGWSFWKVGEVMVGMPTLLPNAPKSIKRRYLARIVCNATGACPTCGAITSDARGADRAIARAQVEHESYCPVGDHGPSLDRWLDPAAEPMRTAIAQQGAGS